MHIDQLESTTQSFFELHWVNGIDIPTWKGNWDWNSSLPNCDLGGVYALLNGKDEIVLSGVGSQQKAVVYP
jgi:hypothetical protein